MSTASIRVSGIEVRVGPRDGPAGRAERGDPLRRHAGAGRERQHQEAVPVAAGQHRAGPPQRVDRLALVELEPARAVGLLDHPRVLVGRLGLVEHAPAVGRLGRPGRERERGDQRGGNEQTARAEARAPRRTPAPRPARGTCAGCRSPRSPTSETKKTPTSEPTVETAYSRPATDAGLLDRRELQPHRPRRDRAEQQQRHGDQHERPEQRGGERADRELVERAHAQRQERVRDERHDRQQRAAEQHEPGQRVLLRAPVGEPAAEPVARPTAPAARPRSCSPRSPSRSRRTAPSAAPRRSPPRACSCRPRRPAPPGAAQPARRTGPQRRHVTEASPVC